ncbi:hypothetical protein GGI20_005390 [Coemansia sp. BCRC 34301]|nr:hypothetical protein GGI20_005390 [Coemansia sp. BCRC 34301]
MSKRISKAVFRIPLAHDVQFIPNLQAAESCGPLYASDRWARTIRRQLTGQQLTQGQTALVIFGSRKVQLYVDKLVAASTTVDTHINTGVVDDETAFGIERCSQETAQRLLPGYNAETMGLRSEIGGYFASGERFRHLNIKPVRSIYVCGVPGVGKSTIARQALDGAGYPAVYGDLCAMVTSAGGTEMADECIKMALDDIVARAKALAPSVIYIDRVDVLSDTTLLSEHGELTKLVSVFVNFVDSVPHNVFLVLESSVELAALPEAAKRCGALQHSLTIGIPTATRREQIIKEVLGQLVSELPDSGGASEAGIDLLCQRVAAATPGYVARDIVRLCRHALLRLLRDSEDCQSAGPVNDLAESMAQLSLAQRAALTQNSYAAKSVFDWQWFGSALQIVRPSQQLEFESASPAKKWANIGGYEAIKQQLQRFVRLATSEVPSRLGIAPPAGILLHGPSGCGKTALALAMIGESNCNVIFIRGSELFSKYLGETEARLRRLFQTARAAAPCIVFMDEIDSIAARREWSSVESGGPALRVLSTLLNEMDGVHETSGVITVGCTNQVSRIDDAILRPGRFDQLVEVGLPTAADRLGILRVLSDRSQVADDVNISDLVRQTDGFSGAEIEQLFREAAMAAMRTSRSAAELKMCDFVGALDKVQAQHFDEY